MLVISITPLLYEGGWGVRFPTALCENMVHSILPTLEAGDPAKSIIQYCQIYKKKRRNYNFAPLHAPYELIASAPFYGSV